MCDNRTSAEVLRGAVEYQSVRATAVQKSRCTSAIQRARTRPVRPPRRCYRRVELGYGTAEREPRAICFPR